MTISTPDICDEHPERITVCELPWQHFGGKRQFAGLVVTVKCFEDNSLVKSTLAEPGKGRVLVVDGGGSTRRALLGDLIAASAVKMAWEGVVIYGCIRDVDEINALPLGVKALGTVPVKTDKRGEGQKDIAVQFGGAQIQPGAYVYADGNGVIVADGQLIL